MFENRVIRGIHKSRYLASWLKANNGCAFKPWKFMEWLSTLEIDGEKLTGEEIREIVNFSTDGKLELEDHARNFLSIKGI